MLEGGGIIMHPLVAAEQAKVPENLKPFVPYVSHIDTVVRDLIGKLVRNGKWSVQERIDFDLLSTERVDLMMPAGLRERVEKRRLRNR